MSVHNGIPRLREAVESILNQTFKNFEFIIVDDASTDDSWKYLKSIKDKQSLRSSQVAGLKRIKLIKNKKNLGLAISLNKALKFAKGNYIARMDADDISLPKRFEEQVKFFKKHPSVDICGTWVNLIDDVGKIIGEKKYQIKEKEIKKSLAWYPPIIHPTLMARSQVFNSLKGYDPSFDMAEDYELLLRAKEKFIMANIPQKLLLWRLWNKRRSRRSMHELDKIDLRIKIEALKRGYFGPAYLLIIVKKFLTTYLLPLPLKLAIAKFTKLA